MPNILIGYKGKFEPFSFDELLKPVAYATEQQDAYEQAYNTLGDSADAIGASLNPNDPGSQKAFEIYNNYTTQLNDARDALLQNSFKDPNVKRDLMDLKKSYGNIQRINNAIIARNEKAKDIAERKAKNPNLRFSPLGTVDQYLEGTAPNIVSLDLKELRERAEKLAKAASTRFHRDGMTYVGNGMYKITNKDGYDQYETFDAIAMATEVDDEGNARFKYPEIAQLYKQLYSDPNVTEFMDAMPNEESAVFEANAVNSAIGEGLLAGMTLKESASYHNKPQSNTTNVYVDNGNGLSTGQATGKTYDFSYQPDNYGYENPDHTATNIDNDLLNTFNVNVLDRYKIPMQMYGKDGLPRLQKTFIEEGLNQFDKMYNKRHPNWKNNAGYAHQHDTDRKEAEKALRNAYNKRYEMIRDISERVGIQPEKSGYIRMPKSVLQEVSKNLHYGNEYKDMPVTKVSIDNEEINNAINTATYTGKNGKKALNIRKIEKINPTSGVATVGNTIADTDLFDDKGNLKDGISVLLPNTYMYIMQDNKPVEALILRVGTVDYAIPAKAFSRETADAVRNSYAANRNVIAGTPYTVTNDNGDSYTYTPEESELFNAYAANMARGAVVQSVGTIKPAQYTNTQPLNPEKKQTKKSK